MPKIVVWRKKITAEEIGAISNDAPSGKYKVIKIYVDPDTGKAFVEYDDTPVE